MGFSCVLVVFWWVSSGFVGSPPVPKEVSRGCDGLKAVILMVLGSVHVSSTYCWVSLC